MRNLDAPESGAVDRQREIALTPTERTGYTKRRKQIWEALHPVEIAVVQVEPPQSGSSMARPQEKGFAASTAESTGMTKQAINRQIARADALGDDVERSDRLHNFVQSLF